MRFEELNLAPQILQALTACGYDEPTPIQAQTIPALLEGRDVIGSAQTGTGKTAAFVLPALHRIAAQPNAPVGQHRMSSVPRVLVLAPTRELAQQVAEQAVRYGQGLKRAHRVPLRRRAVPGAEPRSCSAASTCWSPRPAASWTTSSAAASTCRSCRCWCSTKPTACSTWASSTTSSACAR